MSRDEIGELAAAYALGGLEGADRARFEALLRAADPEAVTALREFEDTLVELAAAAPETPPPAVKARLMERIAAATLADRVEPAGAGRGRRSAVWPAVLSAAMAAGLAAIVVAWTVSARYEKRLDALGRDADRLRADLQSQQEIVTILRDPATQMLALAGLAPAPLARARVLWHAKSGGLLVAAGLPPAPEGKTYQLWAIAGGNAPVSAGVFSVDASGTGSLAVHPLPGVAKVDAFAVTLEPAGGLPAPSGTMYLLGKS